MVDDGESSSHGRRKPRTVRVVFIDQSGHAIGGAERSLQLLISNLPPDIDPTVVLFSEGRYARDLRERGIRVVIFELGARMLTVRREDLRSPRTLLVASGALERIVALRVLLRELAPDVVYTNTVKAHVLGVLAAKLAGVRTVAHLRDILGGRGRSIVAAVLRLCGTQPIAISHAVARSFGLSRTIVIANPVDVPSYGELDPKRDACRVLGLPADVPVIGIIGRINRWKGHDRFLRMAGTVAAATDAHFVVVGAPVFRDADFLQELHDLVVSLRLERRVTFVPWLDDPRVAYAAIDVLCNTSDAEPFGRTIVEAAAAGVPTVCFDAGGAPEAVASGEGGRLVPPGDDAAFAAAVLEYISDPALLERAGAVARKHAQRFDAPRHAARVAAVLYGKSWHNPVAAAPAAVSGGPATVA